jgi:hypothetical protein
MIFRLRKPILKFFGSPSCAEGVTAKKKPPVNAERQQAAIRLGRMVAYADEI